MQTEGTGDPILFVHGFPLDHGQWRAQLAQLEGWRRVAPDLRGAGASDVPDTAYGMPRHADDLVAVLDALGVERAVCCGLSLGGYVLFELLAASPGSGARPDPVRHEGGAGYGRSKTGQGRPLREFLLHSPLG